MSARIQEEERWEKIPGYSGFEVRKDVPSDSACWLRFSEALLRRVPLGTMRLLKDFQ